MIQNVHGLACCGAAACVCAIADGIKLIKSPQLKKAQLYLFYTSEAIKQGDKKIPAICRDFSVMRNRETVSETDWETILSNV